MEEGASEVGLEGYVGAEVMPLGERGSRELLYLSFQIMSPESDSMAQEPCDLHSGNPVTRMQTETGHRLWTLLSGEFLQ